MSDFRKIQQKAFGDELEKRAGELMRTFLGSLIGVPAGVLALHAAKAGVEAIEDAIYARKFSKKFEEMMAARPELRNENQDLVKKYWNTLIHFAPAIAEDPLAAGAFIKQAIQYEEVGGPPYQAIETLAKTQEHFYKARPERRPISQTLTLQAPIVSL